MHPAATDHMRYNTTQKEKSPAYVGINRLHWDGMPMKAVPRIAATSNATTLHGLATTLPSPRDTARQANTLGLVDDFWFRYVGGQPSDSGFPI